PNQQTKLTAAPLDLSSPSDSDGAPPRRRLKKGSENSDHRAKASKPARKPLSELPLQTQKSYRAYISAVETGRLETVQSTLNRWPSFLNQADDKGVTPIMVAASVSNPDMVRLFLVQDDIEPNLQDQAGYTAMMWPEPTANGNYIRTLQTFVDHEKEHPGTLDFSKKDNKGTSAADYATWNLAQTKFSRQQKEQLRALIRDMTPSGA
ncbi:MAG: Ankyrin repeat (many copies), partial [Vampirovibrio sp.]|nr:Ankyrin repeat (many copies) [Vampirovibrio sp.]